MEKRFLFLVLLAVVLLRSWLGVAGNSEATVVCEMKSLTWQGLCVDSTQCSTQCREWEVAAHGACRVVGLRSSCMCYFKLKRSSCLSIMDRGRSVVRDPELESAVRAGGAPFLL